MESIRVYKVYKKMSGVFILGGSLSTLLGITLFIRAVIIGFNTQILSGDWNSVIFTFQGVLFIIMGASNLAGRKYFIEWDDKILRFHLPGNRHPETILFTEIDSVRIKLYEIELNLAKSVKILNLANLEFEDIRKIKEKFEAMSMKNE